MLDLIIKNGQCYIDRQLKDVDVSVKDGKIQNIGKFTEDAKDIIDAKGLTILPGCIDTQTHFREPGSTDTEDLHSGSRAAIAGGITAVFEMPNTDPLTLTPDTIEDKLKRASRVPWTDYAFYLGGTGRTGPNLDKWENAPGICGIKIFMGASTGELMTASDEEVESVLSNGRRVVAVHAEDQYIMQENMKTILKEIG